MADGCVQDHHREHHDGEVRKDEEVGDEKVNALEDDGVDGKAHDKGAQRELVLVAEYKCFKLGHLLFFLPLPRAARQLPQEAHLCTDQK